MLQLRHIRKSYTTADFTQVALNDVSIAFRDNEFVAILGPSGSGKTTLLNIVGGLDHYDSGDLIIDGVSTKDYKDRNWDTYRNNRIGFVFQSYNLIPHQTVVANVELALTLSGVGRAERHARAVDALEKVGLADHVNKLPNQLSGGQMQRVAIARALINDPEILLADEPTGALDSKTSVQIMDLLTQIARDRLVVMVTHNPDLAEQYATRIVNLKDGIIANDSDRFIPGEGADAQRAKPVRKTSMSFFTAVALSFMNLMTKKGRTFMTSFAGSIGIIGIAAILALANGVNAYIRGIEEDTLSVYPLTIQSQGMDFTSLMAASAEMTQKSEGNTSDVHEVQMLHRLFQSVGSNDLASLKKYVDKNSGDIDDYAHAIQYYYDVTPQIFTEYKGTYHQVNPDTSFSALGLGGSTSSSSLISDSVNTNVFLELADDSSLYSDQYDVVAGTWPKDADDVVLVLTANGGISDFVSYAMGLRDPAELDTMVQEMLNNESITTPTDSKDFYYEQLMNVTFSVVNATDYYTYDKNYGVWTDKSSDSAYVAELTAQGEKLHISGIVRPKSSAKVTALQPGLYYTSALTRHLVDEAAQTQIVKDQIAHPKVDVFTGRTFADEAANPDRDDFDIASVLNVDEDTLKQAFTIDDSKLQVDPDALELSMPQLSIDTSALPTLDLSSIASVDTDAIVKSIDLDKIIAGIDTSHIDSGVDADDVATLAKDLGSGYAAYCNTAGDACRDDPDAAFQEFMSTSEGVAIQQRFTDMETTVNNSAEKARQDLTDQVIAGISAQLKPAIAKATTSIQSQLTDQINAYMKQVMQAASAQIEAQLIPALEKQIYAELNTAMDSAAANMANAIDINEDTLKSAFSLNISEDELTQLLTSMMTTQTSSYDGNLAKLGYADQANPSQIDIYPKDFDSKEKIIDILDSYNARMKAAGEDSKVITYTDLVGAMMSSVTSIVNVVSYVLVAFVAISLVVSSIMIGVITYISVLERKKEIGILRSIGASKRDIRWVFNAETLIVGFVAGVLGIAVTLILTIPANMIVYNKLGISNVAQLPWNAALILVAISMALTFLAGLIPASAASRKDPVEALRSE
ncbi:MAG: ABC transporter ATP-binding protein/permease [Ancrocorticia sp.]|jgi:ABC-type lipoprotein export system ATPase subunit/ABC-type antimicrobial peptide transport system permease subunit|nr:ABC transporter ATP-binding protein/permease [Ancrocorticia sp.]MCI2002022.1 ABC transporter ATP-binding protein/permease [Ancrocorticia sp.]MCI2029555.1 ABC transporter ATP-binding protein/permease [Ancrocorticia sp.]